MSLPTTLRAVVARREGGPDGLILADVPVPEPGAGEVLLRVEAASVTFSDVKRRRGDPYPFPTRFPFTPGGEVAGTVAALGPGVTGFAPGDPVFGLVGGDGQGGYAGFARAVATQLAPRPPGLAPELAATPTIAGATAMLLAREVARLGPDDAVPVPAAAGGVGSLRVQLARRAGARAIVAAVGGEEKSALARTLGATATVDERDPGWPAQARRAAGGAGLDVLFEASGGDTLARGLGALAPFGRAVVYGAAGGHDALLDAATLRRFLDAPAPNRSLTAFNVGDWFLHRPQAAGAALGELVGLVAAGAVRVPRIETLPLSAATAVHRRLEARRTSGKIVLDPWAA